MNNPYLPEKAVVKDIVQESPDTKTFTLALAGGRAKPILKYQPGQFLMVSLPGYGEAPFTFASLPGRKGSFQISVRLIGSLTRALHSLKIKDVVGVRGPYGNSFPVARMKNKDLLFVAGGCGIAPLRALIQHVLRNRKDYGKIEIVYGCRAPKDRFYKEEMTSWKTEQDTRLHLTVDEPDRTWEGERGVVCVLFPRIKLSHATALVFLCGPPVMIKFAIPDLLKLGFREANIYASLERHMKCGTGKCGHCYIKDKYVCRDGPNFSYREMKLLGIES